MKTNHEPYVKIGPDRSYFRIARRVFTEGEILEQERKAIFEKCWLYLGHASELPAPGSFVSRPVGGRSLVFVRDISNVIRAFYNTCPHRGMRLCREKSGQTKVFTCFYHGWAFGVDGRQKDMPGREAYPKNFGSDGSTNLVPVERLEEYRDFWFVCFDRGAGSLSDYLADAKEYIDIVADHSEAGMEIISGDQDYGIKANWKLIMENSLDGYHALTTHATYFDYLRNSGLDLLNGGGPIGRPRNLGNGHAVIEYSGAWGRPVAKWASTMGESNRPEVDQIFARVAARHGRERAERICHLNRNIGIFPNLVINDTMGLVVRTFYPASPGQMQVRSWALGPKAESASLRQFRLSNFIEFLGPGGLATPDDVEALENCQIGFSNIEAAPWTDLSKGLGRDVSEQRSEDEEQTRLFWTQWNTFMSGGNVAVTP